MHGISIIDNEDHRLVQADFGVDSCVEYNFEPATPMDPRQRLAIRSRCLSWTLSDVCAGRS
jgi:hypothetical protein